VLAYQRYLEAFPQGRFVAEARARRNELVQDGQQSEEIAQALAAERALGLNALTARVIEQRLDALGLEPGEVDGTFDQATRRALRTTSATAACPSRATSTSRLWFAS
jgi:peptidoglycan hydrolase-like protein with peptidoglycan-binding domain